jgi:hypothetical protein
MSGEPRSRKVAGSQPNPLLIEAGKYLDYVIVVRIRINLVRNDLCLKNSVSRCIRSVEGLKE